MSGHSKWHNIHRDKEKADSEKARVFTRIGREITAAVREGGSDPASNTKLRDIISKARASNVPAENIQRVIDRAAGAGQGASYEEITYEGYGPEGVAIIAEALTDNRNRTASDVRHCFEKYACALGAPGCVSWSFDRLGVIIMDSEGSDEDEVMLDALDAGALDMTAEDGVFEIDTDPAELTAVLEALTKKGYTFISAETELVPQNTVSVTHPRKLLSLKKLLAELEQNEDIRSVWHNWDEKE